ncbi:MAG: polysaccharide lyase family protein [Chthoniobacteraceae bacterium]
MQTTYYNLLLRKALGRLLIIFSIACEVTSAAFAQNVSLIDNETSVVLSNGLVTVVINKGSSDISSFKLGSTELATSSGFYYTTHVVSGTTDQWVGMASGLSSVYSVTTNTSSMMDISFRNTKLGYDATLFPNGMFDVDMHYVMRDGVAGIYKYVIWRHNASQPAAGLYQQRLLVAQTNVTATGTPVYSYCGTDDCWNYAVGSSLTGASTIYDSTYELLSSTAYTAPTGSYYQTNWPEYSTPNSEEMIGLNYNLRPVWTKYDWSVYSGPETSSVNTFGNANDHYGIWILNASQEWLNGGPTKLRGTVQDTALGVNTNEGHGYAVGPDESIAAGATWSKIYGPILIYANTGTAHAYIWSAAKTQGAAEVAAWPYSWLTSPGTSIYPISRGTITGQLVAPGQSTANAQIVVCDRSDIDWVWQGQMNYVFSTQADDNGNFTLSKIRPGTYTINAYVPGIYGDYQKTSVAVTAGATTALGTLTWNVSQKQQLLWRIGTSDRSTSEFRYGDLPKQFGLWWRYYDEVVTYGSGSVDYTIGTSSPAANWYYAQPVIANASGAYVAPSANINFNLATVPSGTCTLTVALAGAIGAGAFNVLVNGTDVDTDAYHGTYTADDSAMDRSAVLRGQQQNFAFTFSPTLLHTGTNTVQIKVRSSTSSWSGTRPVAPAYGIMYDFVQLEAGADTTNTLLSQGKTTTCSSSNGANTSGKGNDGSEANRWESSSTSLPQWWRVDLGAAHTVRSMRTKWYQTNGYKYRIEGSNDDTNWTVLVSKANSVKGIVYDTLSSTTKYRYIRIYVIAATSAVTTSFYETQIYGD